jgi:hypothetical protein
MKSMTHQQLHDFATKISKKAKNAIRKGHRP